MLGKYHFAIDELHNNCSRPTWFVFFFGDKKLESAHDLFWVSYRFFDAEMMLKVIAIEKSKQHFDFAFGSCIVHVSHLIFIEFISQLTLKGNSMK